MNKIIKLLLLFLVVLTISNQFISARSLRVKRDSKYLTIGYWQGLVGLKTTTLPPCLEYAEDDNSCLGEPVELNDDTYEFKHILTAAKACPPGSKLDRKRICRKFLRR